MADSVKRNLAVGDKEGANWKEKEQPNIEKARKEFGRAEANLRKARLGIKEENKNGI